MGKNKLTGRSGKRFSGVRTKSNRGSKSTDDMQQQTPAEWVININDRIKEGNGIDSGRSWTIYRVPRNMGDIHRNAYIPKLVSIGPFHYGDRLLQPMEDHKMRYLWYILGYTCNEECCTPVSVQEPGPSAQVMTPQLNVPVVVDSLVIPEINKEVVGVSLERLEASMKALERKTRECYSETFNYINSEDFVQMMVMDGCFIIRLLRLYYKYYYYEDGLQEPVDDPIFKARWMLRSLQRDLLMLQNQLPFFVLQELFNLIRCPEQDNVSLAELAVRFFNPIIPRERMNMDDLFEADVVYDHLLCLFRGSFITPLKSQYKRGKKKFHPTTPSIRLAQQEKQLNYCVTELQEAGIKFIKKEQNDDLLSIDYDEDGILRIPQLHMDDNTVPLFLNSIAYEQCHEKAQPYFTNHFIFFDCLVNTSKDIDILHNNGILNHVLGSDKDVAHLINKLCREIVYDVDVNHLQRQMKGLNNYYKTYYSTKWHIWMRNLVRQYFSSPWTFLSLIAAIFLLLLTTAQTFFAVYSYVKPSPP
ncbi:hypothetical protein MKW98_022227 [Papaver atlanticum]|uniref:Uncharacterized protein n=1 Tax=Papaver atlanticum TaxID=357466 RepID=A0AAD4XS11_9MAGN|nr:hypothetical protein MKW98_022227 [Papaver atlanticum]